MNKSYLYSTLSVWVCFLCIGVQSGIAETLSKDLEKVMVLHDFTQNAGVGGWGIEDDRVMGGVSAGRFMINEEGHGVFLGEVSLDNNGGFSSVQCDFPPIQVSGFQYAVLRVKGDGKRYQFRIESGTDQRHSYIHYFETQGEWEVIEIPLNEMFPSWRGNRLDLPNFDGTQIAHIRFLIGNGKAESFMLEIDSVSLR